MYIAIAGNIGSGKTSLTEILANRTGARAYYEDSDNPYIGDFYDDMNRWSFNLQIYFWDSGFGRRRRFSPRGPIWCRIERYMRMPTFCHESA